MNDEHSIKPHLHKIFDTTESYHSSDGVHHVHIKRNPGRITNEWAGIYIILPGNPGGN